MPLNRRICSFVKGRRFFPNSCNEPQCKHQISGLQLSGDSAEPYFLTKRSLTGDTSERVDTRVLQAIYAFTQVLPGIRRPAGRRVHQGAEPVGGDQKSNLRPYLLRRAAQRAHRCGGHRGPGRSVMDRRERPESALSRSPAWGVSASGFAPKCVIRDHALNRRLGSERLFAVERDAYAPDPAIRRVGWALYCSGAAPDWRAPCIGISEVAGPAAARR